MAIKFIVFIDDEPNLLNSLKRSLRKYSEKWTISYLESAQAGLDFLEKDPCELLFTDYKMPNMDGLELIRIVREKYPEVKIVLMSGQSEAEVYERSKEIVDLYLSKPCSTEDIVKAIESFS